MKQQKRIPCLPPRLFENSTSVSGHWAGIAVWSPLKAWSRTADEESSWLTVLLVPSMFSRQKQRSRHAECFHSVWSMVWELGFSPRMMTLGLWINPAKQSTALHSPAVWTSNFTTKFLHKWPLAPFYGIYSCSPSIYKGRKKDFRNCISSKGCSKNSKLPARKEIPDMRDWIPFSCCLQHLCLSFDGIQKVDIYVHLLPVKMSQGMCRHCARLMGWLDLQCLEQDYSEWNFAKKKSKVEKINDS